MTAQTIASSATQSGQEWWRSAVFYQVYPRSFADSNGDGMGDLPGVTDKLPYLKGLGVDGIWLSPFYTSPMADAGYDVSDYRDVDPVLGTLADAEKLLRQAHGLGLKVVVDLVPNHTSDEHEWFQAALKAGPGSPERDRYIFRDGKGPNGDQPPNNWFSVFGGGAWERVTEADGTPGQWYLHTFDVKQPDLNWHNADVIEEFHSILRFWLDRGVEGFRVDVAHGLVKAEGLPDWNHHFELLEAPDGLRSPMWDQDGVHDVYRGWRAVLNTYDRDRMLVAEAWVQPAERLARYLRHDEMHQAFNFGFLMAHWDAASQREVITNSLRADAAVGAPTTWVLSNHDVVRHATRLGLDRKQGEPLPDGLTADSDQPDERLGLQRARAATALMLALPGSAYIYQGEELGLPDHTTLDHSVRQDPTYFRTKGARVGRDGCRIPIPWVGGAAGNGFGPAGEPWLPQPESYKTLAADQQQGVAGSTLELYRALLAARREFGLGIGTLEWLDDAADPGNVLRLRNGAVSVVTAFDEATATLPAGAEVLVSSGPIHEGGEVPANTTVWYR